MSHSTITATLYAATRLVLCLRTVTDCTVRPCRIRPTLTSMMDLHNFDRSHNLYSDGFLPIFRKKDTIPCCLQIECTCIGKRLLMILDDKRIPFFTFNTRKLRLFRIKVNANHRCFCIKQRFA